MIDVDIETRGLQPWSYRPFSDDEPFTFLVQFSDGTRDEHGDLVVEIFRHPEDREAIQEWLSRDDDYRAWNTNFDMGGLYVDGYTLPPDDRWHDGKVEAHLIDERKSTGLKARAAILFGEQERDYEKEVKAWLVQETDRRRKEHKAAIYKWLEEQGFPQKRNKNPQVPPGLALPPELKFRLPNYSDVPDELMYPYAAQDVILTERIGKVYENKLVDGLDKLYHEIERPTLVALFHQARRGLPVNREATERLRVAAEESLSIKEARIREMVGKSNFNPASSDQVAETLKRMGADLSFVTKSGKTNKLSMDEENLSAVDHPLAAEILAFRSDKQLLGTYLIPMLQGKPDRAPFIAPDGRIHSHFWQVGARTGRMSSADPNIQNWPRDDLRLRYLAQADEGHKIVAVDMDQIEARVLAMFAGGKLLEAFQRGDDIHTLTAEMVGLQGRQRATGFENPRQQGKRFNYLMMYGGGLRALRKWFLVSMAEARNMVERFYGAYPEVKDLQQEIEWRLNDRGYLKTPYARRQRLERNVREEGYKFLNYLIQGTSADLIKIALVRCHRAGVPVIATIHDEIVAHPREEDAEETCAVMEDALSNFPEVTEFVPLGAEGAIVDFWSQAKDPDFVPEHERELLAA